MTTTSVWPLLGEDVRVAHHRAAVVRRWMAHRPFRQKVHGLAKRFREATHLAWLTDGRIVDSRLVHPAASALESFVLEQASATGSEWVLPQGPAGEAHGPWVNDYRQTATDLALAFGWPEAWGPRAVHYCVARAPALRQWEKEGGEGLPPHVYPLAVWTPWRFEGFMTIPIYPGDSWRQVQPSVVAQIKAVWDRDVAPLLGSNTRGRSSLVRHVDWLFEYVVVGRGYGSVAEQYYTTPAKRSAIESLLAELGMAKPYHAPGRPRKQRGKPAD